MGRQFHSPKVSRGQAQAVRVEKAIMLRAVGKTWQEIADELGWDGPSGNKTAQNAVYKQLRKRAEEAKDKIEEHRQHLLAQLDEAERAIWEIIYKKHVTVSHGKVIRLERTVVDPDTGEETMKMVELEDDGPTMAAIDRLIKIQERRAKLSGLDAPAKAEVGMDVQYTVNGVDINQLK